MRLDEPPGMLAPPHCLEIAVMSLVTSIQLNCLCGVIALPLTLWLCWLRE